MKKSLITFVVAGIAIGMFLIVSILFLCRPSYAKYVMRVNVGKVEIAVERQINSQLPDGERLNRNLEGRFITSIIFDSYVNYPEMRQANGVDIGEYFEGASEEDAIKLYYRGTTAYILSAKPIIVGSCEEMFKSLYWLTTVEFNNFDTANTVSMRDMFYACISLKKVVMNFDTAKVEDMSGMFRHCIELTSADISSFDTSSVVDMSEMFRNCFRLETVFASDKFTVENVRNGKDMFKNCYSLRGGNGTRYSEQNISHLYARIDKKDVSGYFTDKNKA